MRCDSSSIGVEQTWVMEIEPRMTELDSGTVQTISWEQRRAQLYASTSVQTPRNDS